MKKAGAKLYSVISLLAVILVMILSLKADNPPAIVKSNAPAASFSAARAYAHLLEIARAPHSLGTAEHDRVKNYIINTCRQMGFQVETQVATEANLKGNILVAANVENIIVRIPGNKKRKSVLITAHYDSQPNTPGAADDGMGVVAMLETARALKALPQMPHDIIMVFTDGEEEGLFGAKALLRDSSFHTVGFAMNWDFRGNKGTVITYETNPHNGWLIQTYAKGVRYPFGNSMGYEIAKRLPNSADFKYFRRAGVTGFTNGIVEGYSNYHSMTDKPENLDQHTLQQVGDNMLSMAKYVGNMPPLGNTKAPDLSFFNVLGFWFIHYPSIVNIFLLIITTIVFVLIIFIGLLQGKLKLPGMLAGTIALCVSSAATYFLSALLLKRILKHYPLYSHFYGNNSYNADWYFVVMTLLTVFVFSIVFQFASKKWDYTSVFPGILFIGIICMWATYIYTPSASWLFLIPVFSSIVAIILIYGVGIADGKIRDYPLINFISAVPSILLFAPLIYFTFHSFALSSSMPILCIGVSIILALLYPALHSFLRNFPWMLTLLSFLGLGFALFTAHRNSGYDKEHPLQTNISYRLNASDSTAMWFSNSSAVDKFTNNFFPDKKTIALTKKIRALTHSAPTFPFAAPEAILQSDTTIGSERSITLFCKTNRQNVNSIGIDLNGTTSESLVEVDINGRPMLEDLDENDSAFKSIIFYAPPIQGVLVKFIVAAKTKLDLKIFDRSMGIPNVEGLTSFPPDVIPGPGFESNITRVERHYLF